MRGAPTPDRAEASLIVYMVCLILARIVGEDAWGVPPPVEHAGGCEVLLARTVISGPVESEQDRE